jgi:hypothetical protein
MIITRRFSIKESETLSPGTKYQKLGGNDVLTACECFILKNILRQPNARGLVSKEGTLLRRFKYFGNVHIMSQIKVNIFQLSQVLQNVSNQHTLNQYTTRISSIKMYPS